MLYKTQIDPRLVSVLIFVESIVKVVSHFTRTDEYHIFYSSICTFFLFYLNTLNKWFECGSEALSERRRKKRCHWNEIEYFIEQYLWGGKIVVNKQNTHTNKLISLNMWLFWFHEQSNGEKILCCCCFSSWNVWKQWNQLMLRYVYPPSDHLNKLFESQNSLLSVCCIRDENFITLEQEHAYAFVSRHISKFDRYRPEICISGLLSKALKFRSAVWIKVNIFFFRYWCQFC